MPRAKRVAVKEEDGKVGHEHFNAKLEEGAARFREKVEALREKLATEQRPIAEELGKRMDSGTASAITVALLKSISRFVTVYPDGEREFHFEPPPLAWVREALNLPEKTRSAYDVFSAGGVLKALERRPEQARVVASSLLVYALGYDDRGNENAVLLKPLAAKLGLAAAEGGKKGK